MSQDLAKSDIWDNNKMAYSTRTNIPETREDREMQRYIRGRALYSLAILGEAFVRHGSGRFLNLRPPGNYELEARTA